MKPLLILACLALSGCTSASNKSATFQTFGHVKGLAVGPDGAIAAQEVSSPADGILALMTQGMIGKALGVLK